MLERGFDFVVKLMKIFNAADDVLRSIAIAMKRRRSLVAPSLVFMRKSGCFDSVGGRCVGLDLCCQSQGIPSAIR